MTKFATNSSSATRYGVNTLGPLCLWQCFFKRVKNALETICGLINEQRKSKRKKKLGSWMSSHWCNFYFVVPGHQICQKPRLICQIRWPIIFSSLDGIYKQQKAKKLFFSSSNWGFWFFNVPGERILPILQECPINTYSFVILLICWRIISRFPPPVPLINSLAYSMLSFNVPFHGGEKFTFLVA